MTDNVSACVTEGGDGLGAARAEATSDTVEMLLGVGQGGNANGGAVTGAMGAMGAAEGGQGSDPLSAASRQAAEARLGELREQHWQDFQLEQARSVRQHSQQWHQECESDPELGGDRLPVSVARAQMALDRFDNKGRVGQWLQQSGFGNHPDVLRLFNRIADALGDDKVIHGQTVREMPSLEERMYPNWKV